jgi:hypothetical protein
VASGGTQAFATVFGSGFHVGKGDAGKIFHNWSVEMQGSQAIAALSYAPADSNAVALGGARNGDMRFYVNGKDAAGLVTVNIAAAKLVAPWNFPSGNMHATFQELQGTCDWTWTGEKIDDNWQVKSQRGGDGWGKLNVDGGWLVTGQGFQWLVDDTTGELVIRDGAVLDQSDPAFGWGLRKGNYGGEAWRVGKEIDEQWLYVNGDNPNTYVGYYSGSQWYHVNEENCFIDNSGRPIKYSNGWKVYNPQNNIITSTSSSPIAGVPIVFEQLPLDGWARAVAMGPDFQLNVGRTRRVGTYIDDNGAKRPKETAQSIKQGGFSDGRAGTLNLIGAVARAAEETSTTNSRLRIDSGWTVNCFSPVRDVESTEILHGRMVLRARDRAGQHALQKAVDQLSEAICIATNEEKDGQLCTKVYGGGHSAGERAGGIHLDATNYPILGRLTVASGKSQRLLFGTTLRKDDGGKWVHHSAGQLILKGSGTNTFGPQLELWDSGPAFALQLTGADFPFSGPVNSLVVSMPNAADRDAMQALFSVADETPVFGNQLINLRGEGTSYYFLGDDGSLSQKLLLDMGEDYGYETAAADKLCLLWLDDGARRGLVIASVYDNKILKEDLDPILPLPLRFSPGDDSLGGVHFLLFHGELAHFAIAANNLRFSDLRDHCCDVRGSDPFVSAFHGRLEQRASKNNPAFGCNLRGLTLGEDFVRPIGNLALLRLGACISHVNGTLRTFDLAEPLSKTAKPRLTSAGTFATLERWNDKSLKSNALASISLGVGSGKLQRTDGDGNGYWGKTALKFATFRGEVVRNVLCCNGLQLGPWCGANYTILRQGGYAEHGSGEEFANASSVRQKFCNTLLGINLERAGLAESKRGLRLCAKLGWERRVVQRCHAGLATIADSGLTAFRPQSSLGDKNLCHASTSVRQRLGEHWNLSGTWQGNFGKHSTQNSLALTAGYVF